MLQYILRRMLYTIPTLIVISIVSFVLIQLPPGDFLESYAATLSAQGEGINSEQLIALKAAYGLDEPVYVQYWKWIFGILTRGDFGQSFEWRQPVASLLWERMGATLAITFSTLIFTWLLAIPIGVFSATNKYSKLDYLLTGISFVGLGIPGFMIALVLLWVTFNYFGVNLGGLFSPEYVDAPWSPGKVLDLLSHFWIPLIIVGVEGTAALIRTMRANLLDELSRPYVTAGRARGLDERTLIWEYPVRVALNPFVSTLGYALPGLISGATVISVVLNLPTAGPLLLRALQSQDMYLAGAFILLLASLTVVGTLLSDIALAWLDPRIRFS